MTTPLQGHNVIATSIDTDISLLSASKFKSFPVIMASTNWLTESYTKLKETNFVTKCTCGIAESTLKNSMYLATPLVNKFKDQVTSLDSPNLHPGLFESWSTKMNKSIMQLNEELKNYDRINVNDMV